MKKSLGVLICFVVCFELFAAGKGGKGHGSVFDLINPFINFFILFGFLTWKLKKPLSQMFTNKSLEIEEFYHSALDKDKEAQVKLDEYEKKFEGVAKDKEKIIEDAKKTADDFERQATTENESQIQRLKEDAQAKAKYEKEQIIREINASLIDEVISKTKDVISNNKDYRSKATKKLIQEIQ